MRSRKLLALLFCLITFPAIAGYMTLLGAGVGSIAPVVSWVSTTDPTFPSSSLTYSGPSLSTMFDSTGKLTYKPNNLLTYSNTFSNVAWTKNLVTVTGGVSDPVGGSNASTITATGVNAFIYQGPTVAAGTRIASQLYVKRRTGSGSVFLYDQDGFTNTVDITASISGGGWVAINPSVLTASGSNAYIGVKINTSGDALDLYAGVLSAVTYETAVRTADQVITTSSAYYGPRIDYDPNTLAVKGLLIEEARTNLAIQSRSLANATWSKVSITVGSDSTLGVDGITADLLTTTNFIVEHLIYNVAPYTVVSGSTYTFTTFRKAGTGRYWQLGMQGTTGYVSGVFDLSLTADASAVQTSSAIQTLVSATSKYLGSGWHRLQVTFTVASGTAAYIIESAANANGSNTFSGYGSVTNGPANVTYYGSGSQAELGSFATSYTPTAASSVTRAADVVQFTGPALTALQGSAGSAIVQMTDQSVGYGAAGGVVLGGSSTYWLDLASGSMYSNSAGHFLNTANAAVAGSPYRAGVAWNASGRSMAMNGGTVATDAFGGWAATTPYLGSLSGTANFANGHVASFAIYNQRLPDATLQAKSVVGASYAANDNANPFAPKFAVNDNLPIHWRVAL